MRGKVCCRPPGIPLLPKKSNFETVAAPCLRGAQPATAPLSGHRKSFDSRHPATPVVDLPRLGDRIAAVSHGLKLVGIERMGDLRMPGRPQAGISKGAR
jgi:hypothetical protein